MISASSSGTTSKLNCRRLAADTGVPDTLDVIFSPQNSVLTMYPIIHEFGAYERK